MAAGDLVREKPLSSPARSIEPSASRRAAIVRCDAQLDPGSQADSQRGTYAPEATDAERMISASSAAPRIFSIFDSLPK